MEYKIKEVVEMVLKLMNSSLEPKMGALDYRPGETWHFYCDNTKAREILDWRPKVGLEDGLRRTIDWFREHYIQQNQKGD